MHRRLPTFMLVPPLTLALMLGSAAVHAETADDAGLLGRAGEIVTNALATTGDAVSATTGVVATSVSATLSAVKDPVSALFAAAPSPAPAAVPDRDDAVDDRGLVEMTLTLVTDAWTWFSYTMGSMFASVTPPTPATMVRGLQDDQQSEFFQFLGHSGYKLKEIENGVGLPPDITLSFGRIRELTEADIDFIDRELGRWAKRDSGVLADTQRAVISTLVSINESQSYVVQSVKMRILPLPQVKFTIGPFEGGLSEQDSVLLRAIQRLDRRVATGLLEKK